MKSANQFRFNSGRISLDLPATVRRRASDPEDVLSPVGATAEWLQGAGLTDRIFGLSDAQVREVTALREAIWRSAAAASKGQPLPRSSVRILNATASRPIAVPQLDTATEAVKFVADDPFENALAMLARDAIDLLGGPLKSRIKACAQPDCQMLFLDASRSSRRRWCSMDRCGSRAKGLTFRNRKQEDLS
jgi:predicted RNA-binding Zn ribbon-like protein